MEETPEKIISDSIREFCHIHDDGVCKPDCYACFQEREGKRALDLQREQIAKLIEEFENWKWLPDEHELSRELGAGGSYPDMQASLNELAKQVRTGEERSK